MTRRERVIAALNHQETDIIPYQIDMTHQAWEKMVEFYGDNNFTIGMGNHFASVYYDGDNVPIPGKDGYFKDDFGVVWNRNGADKDIGVVEQFLIPEPTMEGYKFPKVPVERIHERCRYVMEHQVEDKFRLGAIGFSLFERAWTLTGMENLLEYMITDPDFVVELLDTITAYNMDVMNIFLEYDFDCIHFGDDWGQQQGLIMGPKLWRKFIKPQLAKMYALAKDNGRYVSQHSCGDIQEVYPDLIEIGLNMHQTFQPEIFDIHKIKSMYGDKLTFWGGISTQRLMPFATPEELVETAKEIMQVVGRGGGYICAPTHGIPGDVPAENIHALIEFMKGQG
ncbi:MAG: uroporphyrinogen decarboxylase [Defluviitaleaceae bacterium]|nr:uroporphyrinogen decarboxylase [Defluviitaleaceae bacterium]